MKFCVILVALAAYAVATPARLEEVSGNHNIAPDAPKVQHEPIDLPPILETPTNIREAETLAQASANIVERHLKTVEDARNTVSRFLDGPITSETASIINKAIRDAAKSTVACRNAKEICGDAYSFAMRTGGGDDDVKRVEKTRFRADGARNAAIDAKMDVDFYAGLVRKRLRDAGLDPSGGDANAPKSSWEAFNEFLYDGDAGVNVDPYGARSTEPKSMVDVVLENSGRVAVGVVLVAASIHLIRALLANRRRRAAMNSTNSTVIPVPISAPSNVTSNSTVHAL